MTRGRVAILVLTGLVGLALSGCAESHEQDVPSGSTSSQGSAFESRDEAAAAFEATYKEYIATTNAVAADGGTDVARIKALVTEAAFSEEVTSMKRYEQDGLHLDGGARVTNAELQSANLVAGTGASYFCLDVSEARIVTTDGRDVTPDDRAPRQALLVQFVKGPLVDSSEAWSGAGVC